ncbi:replication initiation negative regulator SeqA [Ferrimonas lipolytica]|uniref:Negative modulator of initiation of replication n=1 Tax=Ferrimonas lipolytica TaxID=2724191 RepID=A0A6H1UBE3_9GAMM|nr:replication initiation negative regulator SeqA [Ferrimonas lipolytica]QIZ76158.1 replication initiation negative regulator SeqA [Ferrimonas lipolytica]
MKYIEIDDELYRHIAGNTQRIGESASDILRRLLGLEVESSEESVPKQLSEPSREAIAKPAKKESTPVRSAVAESGVFEELVNDKALSKQKGAVGRFTYLLDAVYRQFPSSFGAVLEIRGRDRLYFSTGKDDLLASSKTANPKQIGSSPYWVSANNNTRRKQTILEEVLVKLGCDSELADQIALQI